MHELSITRNLVAIVHDAAKGRRVRRVWLEIGAGSAVMPDAVRFCFDVVAQGTLLDGAALEIVELPGSWRCLDCGETVDDRQAGFDGDHCPGCASPALLREGAGDRLNIKAMELEPCA